MKQLEFWKQSAGSAVATAFRIACVFVTNKFLAAVMGPVGFALVGQLQNLITLGQGTSSLALQNGWISLTARYKDDEKSLGPIWRGGFRLSVYASIFTAIVFALFAFLAPLQTIFPGVPTRYMQAAIFFAIPGMIALTVTAICSSVMCGLSDYKRWAAITTVSSVLNCVWIVLMVQTKSLTVLSAVASQSIVSCVFVIWNAHRGGFRYKRFGARLVANFKPWRNYAAMGLVPVILSPLLYLLIRSFLGNHFGWDIAGFWQGAMRISDFLIVVFSSVLGVVLLPKLSAATSKEAFFEILKPSLLRILGIALAMVLLLAIFREKVIVIALTEKFLPLGSLILPQFIGDFFKVGCWCLGLALVARGETLRFLLVEIGADILFAGLTFGGSLWMGYRSPFAAYAIENALCFFALLPIVWSMPWKAR